MVRLRGNIGVATPEGVVQTCKRAIEASEVGGDGVRLVRGTEEVIGGLDYVDV